MLWISSIIRTNIAIFIPQITAGKAANPVPNGVIGQRGGLTNGVQAPIPPNCDLPTNLVTFVTYNPALGDAPVQQFTVVKAYYEHDPITPFEKLPWFGGNTMTGSTVMFSEAIF